MKNALLLALFISLLFSATAFAQASLSSGIVINEILADPTSGGGGFDTDGDGTAESDDEFVELYNNGISPVNIAGWQLFDNINLKHEFAGGTVLAAGARICVVGDVAGGAAPAGCVVASTGGLGINDSGDELFLCNPTTGNYISARFNGFDIATPGTFNAACTTDQGSDDFGSDTDTESLQRFPDGSTNITSAMPTPGLVNLPVELVAFDAVADRHSVVLRWATASETNNAGFEVQHRLGDAFHTLAFVEGRGTTTEAQTYQHRLDDLAPGRHAFRLKQIDFDGAFAYSPVVEALVEVPGTHLLSAAYPNPFNPQTRFTLTVAQAQQVKVAVFDVLGRQVLSLYTGRLAANTPLLLSFNAGDLPSGLYLYRATGETFTATRHVTLLK